jgi:hypothetical protein
VTTEEQPVVGEQPETPDMPSAMFVPAPAETVSLVT